MALRKIICIEDELLRKKSRPVEKFDEKLHRLLDDMAETMYNANGVGLAAPQVAVLRRVVVMDCGDGLIEMVNPEILETEGEQDGPEGCLSVPGRRGMVKRPMKVRAKFQDRNGEWYEIEAEELLALHHARDGSPRRKAVCGYHVPRAVRRGRRGRDGGITRENCVHGHAGFCRSVAARAD